MKGLVLLLVCLASISCAITATKKGDTMTLSGFGAKSASWPDGYSIEKKEPFSVPDVLVDR